MSTQKHIPSTFPPNPPHLLYAPLYTHSHLCHTDAHMQDTCATLMHINLFYARCTKARTRVSRVSTGLGAQIKGAPKLNNQDQSYFNTIFLKIKMNAELHEDQNTKMVNKDGI